MTILQFFNIVLSLSAGVVNAWRYKQQQNAEEKDT